MECATCLGLLVMGLSSPAAVAPAPTLAAQPLLREAQVIRLQNPCEEGTAFEKQYGTSVMEQYGFRSCPMPLF